MATREEIEELKRNWFRDPIWDLYETGDEFDEHREELMAYQKECEELWAQQREERELELKRKAESLGFVGLYKMLLEQQEELEKLRRKVDNDY